MSEGAAEPGRERRRWRIDLAWDGRPYAGWQSLPTGKAIQDHVEAALARIVGPGCRVHGAGRTDRGVHADQQVAHFDAPTSLSLDAGAWRRALNAGLPGTIRVMAVAAVDGSFHSRFLDHRKTYAYRIHQGAVLPPRLCGLAWHHPGAIDREVVAEAAAFFAGEHDFAAFAASRGKNTPPPATTVRRLFHAGASFGDDEILLRFTGNGFLFRMVRLMTGAIVRCGRGRLTPGELRDRLERPGETCPWCAPPDGLVLESIVYDPPPADAAGADGAA